MIGSDEDDLSDDASAALMLAAARGEPLSDAAALLRPSVVLGTLAQMALTEMMQMMEFGKKSACVEVITRRVAGAVDVHDGQIVRASARPLPSGGGTLGEPAFVLLCREKDGFFRIRYGRQAVERNIQRPTTFVLLDAMRLIDESASDPGASASAFGSDGLTDAERALLAEALDEPAELRDAEQDARHACALDVDVDGVSHILDDIGRGGAFIRSDAPPPPGSTLSLHIAGRGGHPTVQVHAHVAHVVEAGGEEAGRFPGMGVRFDLAALDTEARGRLDHIVDAVALRAVLPDRAPSAPSAADARAHAASLPQVAPTETAVVLPAAFSETEGETEGDSNDKLELPGSSTLDVLADVDFYIATGDLKSAQQALVHAQQTAPGDEDIRRRVAEVNEQIQAAQATAHLHQAERAAGKPEAVEHGRRAMLLRPTRDVLLRCLAVFAQARAHESVADVAGRLLELDPDDEGALRTWLDANIDLQRWHIAMRGAEALLRRRPGDEQLKQLLVRLVQRARVR